MLLALLHHTVAALTTTPTPSPALALPASLTPAGFTPPTTASDTLGVGRNVALPLITAATFLIPAGVAFSGLHKLLNHQETGGGFLTEMILKGGGAILLIHLFTSFSGLQ